MEELPQGLKMNMFNWCNSLASVSGLAWAYVAYKYNWLNIGGGESRLKEFWIAASGLVPYAALCIWLAALVLVATHDRRRSLPAKHRRWRLAITFFLAPIVLFTADWLLHRGFPEPAI